MAGLTKITDGSGTKTLAQVTTRGQLVTGTSGFSKAYSVILIADDTPLNLTGPSSGENFIITDIIIRGDKSISNTVDAIVSVYGSSVGPTSATQTEVILPVTIPRSGNITLNGLNLEVTEGYWVNAVTSDDNVYVTVMGYYICAC